MAVWLVRAGSQGEHEEKFIQESRVYVTWDGFAKDLAKLEDRRSLNKVLSEQYPNSKPRTVANWVTQLWPFAHEMKKGDLVVVPLKRQPAIQFGEVTSEYQFNPVAPNPFFHWRSVRWVGHAIPRATFAQDMLHSFGAFLTICRVRRNDAEKRIEAMRANGWKSETSGPIAKSS